jgi:hypothetical protein
VIHKNGISATLAINNEAPPLQERGDLGCNAVPTHAVFYINIPIKMSEASKVQSFRLVQLFFFHSHSTIFA